MMGWALRLAREIAPRVGALGDVYRAAGFEEPLESYLAKLVAAYALSAPAVAAAAVVVHALVLRYPPLAAAVLSFLLLVIYTLLFVLFALSYPLYRRYSRAVSIDSRLPYTIAYFSALAASGMGLEGVVERVAEVEEVKATRRELELLLTDLRLLGLDVLTALERRVKACPSVALSLFFAGLRDAYITAGNLYEYAAFTARRLIELKRHELRRIVNTVSTLAEVYVTMMVAAPLMFVVMLSVISMLGGTVGGLPPQLLMAILIAVGVPASAAAILVALDGVLSRA